MMMMMIISKIHSIKFYHFSILFVSCNTESYFCRIKKKQQQQQLNNFDERHNWQIEFIIFKYVMKLKILYMRILYRIMDIDVWCVNMFIVQWMSALAFNDQVKVKQNNVTINYYRLANYFSKQSNAKRILYLKERKYYMWPPLLEHEVCSLRSLRSKQWMISNKNSFFQFL